MSAAYLTGDQVAQLLALARWEWRRQPIPCRGALGLWDVPADVEAQIATQLQGATHVHA